MLWGWLGITDHSQIWNLGQRLYIHTWPARPFPLSKNQNLFNGWTNHNRCSTNTESMQKVESPVRSKHTVGQLTAFEISWRALEDLRTPRTVVRSVHTPSVNRVVKIEIHRSSCKITTILWQKKLQRWTKQERKRGKLAKIPFNFSFILAIVKISFKNLWILTVITHPEKLRSRSTYEDLLVVPEHHDWKYVKPPPP